MVRTGLILPVLALVFALASGCDNRDRTEERKVAEDIEVNDRLFGGTEVEKKEVIRKENGQYEVREHETKLDEDGNVEKQETDVKRPNGDGASVNVRGSEGGVSVDVETGDAD